MLSITISSDHSLPRPEGLEPTVGAETPGVFATAFCKAAAGSNGVEESPPFDASHGPLTDTVPVTLPSTTLSIGESGAGFMLFMEAIVLLKQTASDKSPQSASKPMISGGETHELIPTEPSLLVIHVPGQLEQELLWLWSWYLFFGQGLQLGLPPVRSRKFPPVHTGENNVISHNIKFNSIDTE